MKVPGWVCVDPVTGGCVDPVTGEVDHDWKIETDWYGDPDVINGTHTWSYRVCRQCGIEDNETPVTPEDLHDYYEDGFG